MIFRSVSLNSDTWSLTHLSEGMFVSWHPALALAPVLHLYFPTPAPALNLFLPALAINLRLPVLRFTVKVCDSYSVDLYKLR